MTNRSDETERPRDVAFTAVFALLITAMACAVVLCAVPRAAPLELPVLVLDADQVRAQITEDERLAALPQQDLARTLYQALRDVGRSELDHDEARAYALEQRIKILKKRAPTELSRDELRAVRAYATERFMLALSAQLGDENETRELLGAQRSILVTHGYMTQGGNLLAPVLTVRAMCKVRWNMVFGAPLTDGLSNTELLAHEGFRALEAQNLPANVRLSAMYELIRAGGGLRAERALAILQASHGKAGPLLARVQGAASEATQLRLRNMALAVLPRSDPQ